MPARTLIATVALAAFQAQALEPVEIRSLALDAQGAPTVLRGFFAPAPDSASSVRPAPAVLLLHGCGGAYARDGALDPRLPAVAALAREEGYAAMVLDSFSSRSVREICTQPFSARRVDTTLRRQDVWGALGWLAARADVDAARLVLIGFSHGGSTVLSTIGRAPPEGAARVAAAIAFYPGCRGYLQRKPPFEPRARLLVLIGDEDDWTPAERCAELLSELRSRGREFELLRFPGAHHGFDSENPVRVREGIPNSPSGRVHTGGHPPSRAQALGRVRALLRELR